MRELDLIRYNYKRSLKWLANNGQRKPPKHIQRGLDEFRALEEFRVAQEDRRRLEEWEKSHNAEDEKDVPPIPQSRGVILPKTGARHLLLAYSQLLEEEQTHG